MDDVPLHVRPAAAGWVVESAGRLQALRFRSGARAEAQAHLLARALARAGDDARVVVHDHGDRIVATTRYFAEDL